MSDRGRAATYDRRFVAALYDVDVRLTSRLIWGASVSSQARFMADVLRAGPALDVPAGTGLITAKALTMCDDAPLVVAVDLSRQVLLRARHRLAGRAVYVEADVEHLPFRDGAFGSAHSSNGFHLFRDTSRAAREIARTCRPRARVAATTWTDRGSVIARSYQRLLARLGHIEPPRPPEAHVSTLEAAGLITETSMVTGTLLQWTGHKRQ